VEQEFLTAGMHMNSIFTGLDYMSKKSLKIPKRGNQNPYIEEEQTTQWPKATTCAISAYHT
jgi:hypothetical protein